MDAPSPPRKTTETADFAPFSAALSISVSSTYDVDVVNLASTSALTLPLSSLPWLDRILHTLRQPHKSCIQGYVSPYTQSTWDRCHRAYIHIKVYSQQKTDMH